jgi:AraC-like DNA-binding protein
MNTALGLLREGPSVAEVAARLGYQSEAAFNRAFKRVTGVTPGSIRQDDKPPPGGSQT